MKNIYFLIIAILISSENLFAQAPQKFNYQAVARDASGNLIANQSVNFRISILQASASGTAVYVETHAKTTNAFGQATLVIGGGTLVSGNFSTISWGNNSYYLKTEMDATGGTTFAMMGTTQLLSVPYALYSNTAGCGGTTYTGGTGINVSGTTINNTAPDQTVVLTGTGATTVTGTYPNFSINSTDNNTTYTAGSGISVAGTVISNTQPNATHTGDVTGNSALTVVKIQGRDIATNAPANGQALKWNSSTLKWEPATDMNTTYTNGNGINITGSTISNTSPDQTVTLNGTGATTVSGTYPNFTINSTDNNTTYTSGTGINISGTTVNNTAPDQTVTITSGTGISATGSYPNFTIANTSPDQIVNLTGNGATEIIGTYPNFTIKSTDNNTIYNAGTGIEINGTTISNTQPNAIHTGDVTGDDTLTVVSLRGNPLSTNNPNTGQVLKWNGTEWDPSIMDVLPTGYMGQTLMYDATNWIATSNFYNDGNNIGINIFPASDRLQIHNGSVSITNNNGLPGNLKLYESSDDGQNFTAFKAQSQTGDITYTLPATSGNNGEVLTTNGMGDLSWTSGGSIMPAGNMGQTLWNNGTNWLSSNLLFNNDTCIGIGTTTPTAQFHVNGLASGKGNILFEGLLKNPFNGLTPGQAPANGAGTRMMWYPDKAAFRVGYVDGNNWDSDSIGLWSVAMGFDTKASKYSSTAMGESTNASGILSTTMGNYSTASGTTSTAIGFATRASGNVSTAMGSITLASGSKSTAMGDNTIASGEISFAIGEGTNASGRNSTALGGFTKASGDMSTTMGSGTNAKSFSETALGCFNTDYTQNDSISWNANDRLFVLGNGINQWNKSNAITVLKNGNTGLGTDNPHSIFEVVGNGTGGGNICFSGTYKSSNPGSLPFYGTGTRMIWYPDKAAFRAGYVDGPNWDTDSIGLWSLAMGFDTKASGYSSTAIGEKTTASGSKSTAMGGYTTATGSSSTAMGYSTIASGEGSTAMGWLTRATGEKSTTMGFGTTASGSYSTAMGEFSTASGEKSTAIGDQTTASGISSTSMGTNTKAKSYAETVIGCYNTDYSQSDSTWWNVNDRLFVIGNGTYSNRSNALTMLKNGNTGLGFENPIKKLEVNGEIKGLRLIAYGPGNVNTNTAIGEQALNIINTGNFNTAIGSNSLMVNSIGNNNVAIGTNALYTNSTGNNNIGIGVNATVLYNNSNSIAIGDLSVSYTSNMAVIGNTATSIIGGYVDWSILSDGRFKRNIKQNVPGISFIMKLHPVTYNLDINKLNRAIYHTDTIAFDKESINSKEKEIQSGFIAQDVEKAAQEVGYDFNGVVKPQNENEHYALRYAEFVVPLVKAVQEQQLMIEELKKQNEELLKRLEKLENK